MIACMIHLALWGLFGFDIFPDEEIGELIKAIADLFNLYVCKIPLAEVLFAFLNREHGNPDDVLIAMFPSAQGLSAASGWFKFIVSKTQDFSVVLLNLTGLLREIRITSPFARSMATL